MLKKQFVNKKILITGAAGSIGSKLVYLLIKHDCKLILLDQAESALYELQQDLKKEKKSNFKIVIGDVSNTLKMDAIFKKYQPNIVYHAAAYKHVPLMENNPEEAIRVNVLGTANIVDLSIKYKTDKFIMISTDKAVNPTSVMGASKRLAELYIEEESKKTSTQFIILRFGNILNTNGSIVPLLEKQLNNNQALTITHLDVSRYFMSVTEVCNLIIKATVLSNQNETFLFDMGNPIKIIDLLKKIIAKKGLKYPDDVDIDIIGLRAGEKLNEELLRKTEITEPTSSNKILKIKKNSQNTSTKSAIIKLCQNFEKKSINEIKSAIKKIIPEYVSSNSVYKN